MVEKWSKSFRAQKITKTSSCQLGSDLLGQPTAQFQNKISAKPTALFDLAEWAKPEKRDAAVCNKTFNKQLAKLDAFPEKFAGSSKACCESAPAGTSIQNTKETVNEQRSKEDKQPTRVKQESRLPTAPSNNLCQLAFGAKGVYISLNQPPIHDALGTVSRAQVG